MPGWNRNDKVQRLSFRIWFLRSPFQPALSVVGDGFNTWLGSREYSKASDGVIVWRLGFGRIAAGEFVMMAVVNAMFILMNMAALNRGAFAFNHPNFLGMPVYEYLMWGFYTLHTIRFLDGERAARPDYPRSRRRGSFVLPFAIIAEPVLLLLTSAAVLAAAISLFHEKTDLAYAAYMAVLGALIEYVGVATGQWHYPGQPEGGVPLWFLTLWAGVGLFTRRLVLPLLCGPCGRLGSHFLSRGKGG